MEENRTRVVHCKKEPFDIYIGRPSKWGNPFSHKDDTTAEFKVNTREEAVESYRNWIVTQPQLLKDLGELKGKVLGCWCKPLSCHGDILAELAEQKFCVIIAGTRTFADYTLMSHKLDKIFENQRNITIVSGTARGADALGERYAEEHGYEIARYPANWNLNGRAAGYIRNEEMARNADACVVFWDGESRGTGHMIDLAKQYGLQLRVVKYTPEELPPVNPDTYNAIDELPW